jgi:hypothetical protein
MSCVQLTTSPSCALLSRRSYPSYETYLSAVEVQKEREFASSFLSAKEVKALTAAEAAEAALAAHESKDPSSSAPATVAAASLAGRDLKPLEGTCWVRSKVLAYLANTPAATQNSEAVATFLSESKSLLAERAKENRVKEEDTRLTVCELIQLVNLRPASLVEIHRAIEECEERLSEEDTLALLDLIERTLPTAPPRAGAGAAAEEEPPQDDPMEADHMDQ